jgi:hypothetical protein
MSRLALHVYVSYTLSATPELSAQLETGNNGSTGIDRCITACKAVLRYVRSAQYVCGSIGLAAIDRSQENLRLCIRNMNSVITRLNDRAALSVSALCYSNALNRRCTGDFELHELWMFAAKCLDTIISRKSIPPCVFEAQSTSTWTRRALTSNAAKFDANQKAALKSGKTWSSKLLRRASHFCRLAVACSRISEICGTGSTFLPAAMQAICITMEQQCSAAETAASLIKDYAATWDIADRAHPVETQGIVRTAALRLEDAVELVAARSTESCGLSSAYDNGAPVDKQNRANAMASNASTLASLASALSAVLTQLADMRAAAAVPAQFLDNIAEQVQRLTSEITASANNSGDDAVHVQGEARLSAAIADIARQLAGARYSAAVWEERVLKRYLTEGEKVHKEASPAHPHIAECWLQAAKLAGDAREALTVRKNASYSAKLRDCSMSCERLATGTFRDAVDYFAKADRTPCVHAGLLWTEAAKLLLQVGIGQLWDVKQLAPIAWFHRCTLRSETDEEVAQLRCAAICAACAAALESAPTEEVEAAVVTLSGCCSADVAVTVDNGSTCSDDNGNTVLPLHLLQVYLERAVLMHHRLGADPDSALRRLRALTEAMLLLSQPCPVVLPSYPEGHLLHISTEPTEVLQQRRELLRWLTHCAIDCYLHLQRTLETQRLQTCPSAHCDKAVESIRTAVRQAHGILLYAVGKGCSYDRPYEVRTYEQANVQRVLCKLSLAASRQILADQLLSHALLVRAVRLHSDQSSTSFTCALSNALVRSAYHLPSQRLPPHEPMDESLPLDLLLSMPVHGAETENLTGLQEILHAHVQQAQHIIALEEDDFQVQEEESLHSSAIEHYDYVINGYMIHTSKKPAPFVKDVCVRAMRAANWFGRAVEALHEQRCDEAGLYERAADCCVIVNSGAVYCTEDKQAQPVGDQAANHFAAAAIALCAGDRPLYHTWLSAAEATAALLDVSQRTSKSTAPSKIAFSADYSTATLAAANRLAAQALAQQGTRQVSTSQQNIAVLAGSVGLQASEPALAAAPAQETVHGIAGTRRSKRVAEVKTDAGAEGTASSVKRKRG